MTVLVTGANGHVGANLVRALLAQGRPTRALFHVNRQAIEGLDIETIQGDIRDLESLYNIFDGAEVVYHLAADISLLMNSWPLLKSVNVIGTRNVVEACLRCGVHRLIYISSVSALVQEPKHIPLDESRPLVESHDYPPYDRSKAAGEKEVSKGIQRGLDAVIISPTAIIGPYDYKPSYFGEVLLALACGKLPALVSGGSDLVDVRDVVEGVMRAEKKAPPGAKYLLSGHWVSVRELAAMVAEITGVSAPSVVFPKWLARLGAPVVTAFDRLRGRQPLYTTVSIKALSANRNVSHERATRELDYHPRPLRETLSDTLQWFEENGYLDIN